MRPGILLVDPTTLFTDSRCQVGRAQLKALSFLGLQGGAGALADQFPFMLGQHGHDTYGERVGIRNIAGHEVDFGIPQ